MQELKLWLLGLITNCGSLTDWSISISGKWLRWNSPPTNPRPWFFPEKDWNAIFRWEERPYPWWSLSEILLAWNEKREWGKRETNWSGQQQPCYSRCTGEAEAQFLDEPLYLLVSPSPCPHFRSCVVGSDRKNKVVTERIRSRRALE